MSKIKYNTVILISELHRFVNENGRIPTNKDMKNGYPSCNTYIKFFKSWNRALEVAGFSVNKQYNYTNEFLISEIHRFVNEYGRSPCNYEMTCANGYPAGRIYSEHFTSWNNALLIAGVKLNTTHHDENDMCYNCGSTSSKGCWKYDKSDNLICSSCYNKNYFKTHPHKVKIYNHRHYDKRSNYKSNPINTPFNIAEGHHLWLSSYMGSKIFTSIISS